MGSLYFWAADASLEDLVDAAKADPSNSSIAMNEIVVRFDPLAKKLASLLTRDYHLQQDIANDARYGAVLAVRAHKPGTPGLAAYIKVTMRGEAHRAIGRNTEEHETVKADDSPVWTGTRNLVEEASVIDSDLGLITEDLSGDQRVLVLKRYIIGDSMSDIAHEAGTSVSATSQRFKTIHKIVAVTALSYGLAG
jgi:RNA polymerase sigma factor (sigma-70 family)